MNRVTVLLLFAIALSGSILFFSFEVRSRKSRSTALESIESPTIQTDDLESDANLPTKAFAQQQSQRQYGGGRGYRSWRRRRDPNDRGGVPMWKNENADPDDVFTFVRIQYSSYRGRYRWDTDYPDADLNFSYRLQQLTAIKADPKGKILRLTDKELFKYPFIYIIEPGGMTLSEAEVVALREYLERGGFLMVDDFWGEAEWANFKFEIGRVFPDRPIEDIPLDHEIFNIVYKIKKKPLIPSVHAYQNGNWTERWDAREAHYRCIKDDSGRLMTVICHNTDLGDGWEQEGTDPGYFKEYSEPYAYPLGINIITYAMTH